MPTYTNIADVPLGSIGLTQIHGDVGTLIRFGQWLNGDGYADYEHAFVYVGDGEIVEAEPGGAQHVPFHYDLSRVAWIPCPPEHSALMRTFALRFVGTPYSSLDYFALAAHRIHLPVPGLRTFINARGHMICSQLADRAARLAGWNLFADKRWSGYVTPGALYKLAAIL